MEISCTFNLWDSLFSLASIIIGAIVAFLVYMLSKQLSARDKYLREIEITKEIEALGYKSVILADVSKYNSLRKDPTNNTYYKQAAEFYAIVSEYGVQFILRPNYDEIPVGLVPFEWIKYVREYDSEDNKPIVVCDFKGVKWYENFKSPFKEISYVYNNPKYKKGSDPEQSKFTTIKPSE